MFFYKIKLAADAANMVAMTDEEKARVGTLLSDLDALPESLEEESVEVIIQKKAMSYHN